MKELILKSKPMLIKLIKSASLSKDNKNYLKKCKIKLKSPNKWKQTINKPQMI